MFKDKLTNEAMYPILGYDNHSVSRTGKVGKCLRIPGNNDEYQSYTPVNAYQKNGKLWVRITNAHAERGELLVAKLVINSKYGELPFNIIYKDGNVLNVDHDNLYYDFASCKIQDGLVCEGVKHEGKFLILSDRKNNFEVFKPVPDKTYPNNEKYWVSNRGVVFDYSRKMLVSRSNDGKGYYKVALSTMQDIDGTTRAVQSFFKIHILVYTSWVDADLEGWTIDHVDGRRHNNDVLNLEKVTFQENLRRAHDKNLDDKNIIRSKWSVGQAELACKMMEDGRSYQDIAFAFGMDADSKSKDYMSVSNLCNAIRRGVTFQDISVNYKLPESGVRYGRTYRPEFKFDPRDIREICVLLTKGTPLKEIISQFEGKVSSGTIYNIKIGKQYRHIADGVPGMDVVINTRLLDRRAS